MLAGFSRLASSIGGWFTRRTAEGTRNMSAWGFAIVAKPIAPCSTVVGETLTSLAPFAGGVVVPGGLVGGGVPGGLLAGGEVVAGAPGVGIACAVNVGGGGGAADPWPNCHVHAAVPCEPPGCITPTLPFTGDVLEPFAVAFVLGATGAETSMTGNPHSNASAAILPGVCGFPEMVTC